MDKQTKVVLDRFLFIRLTGTRTSAGTQASFFSMGKSKYGIKIYKDVNLAMSSYERQKKASRKGLAPKVGKLIFARLGNRSDLYYGYETEKAKSVSHTDNIWRKQSTSLRNKLEKIKLGGDFYPLNCGILHGKLVGIDFGSHSVSN